MLKPSSPASLRRITQAQAAELLLRQLAGEEALGLVAELGDPLVHQSLVQLIVTVHGNSGRYTTIIRARTLAPALGHKVITNRSKRPCPI